MYVERQTGRQLFVCKTQPRFHFKPTTWAMDVSRRAKKFRETSQFSGRIGFQQRLRKGGLILWGYFVGKQELWYDIPRTFLSRGTGQALRTPWTRPQNPSPRSSRSAARPQDLPHIVQKTSSHLFMDFTKWKVNTKRHRVALRRKRSQQQIRGLRASAWCLINQGRIHLGLNPENIPSPPPPKLIVQSLPSSRKCTTT